MSDLARFMRPPKSQPISMSYALHESGWASFRVRCGEAEFAIAQFGNVTDGLGDIVRAALSVVTGGSYAEVLFDCEPRRWGLAVEPAGLEDIQDPPFRVCRVSISDGGGDSLKDIGYSGRPVWSWDCAPAFEVFVRSDDFGKAVLEMAEVVRTQFSDGAYRERWGHYASLEGFPLRGLTALSAALSIQEYRP